MPPYGEVEIDPEQDVDNEDGDPSLVNIPDFSIQLQHPHGETKMPEAIA